MRRKIQFLITVAFLVICTIFFVACNSKMPVLKEFSITGKPEGLLADISQKELPLGVGYAPEQVSPFSVAWNSSNDKVAEIGADGNLILKGAGTVTILAETFGKEGHAALKDSFTLTVTDKVREQAEEQVMADCPVTSIAIAGKPGSNSVGYKNGVFTLSYTHEVKNDDPFFVIWTSSNSSVATIDADGRVTVHRIGVTTIRVRVLGSLISDSFELRVTGDGVQNIGFNSNKMKVMVGKSIRLDTATTYIPSNCVAFGTKWTSSDTKIATVSSGIVKGVKPGMVMVSQAVLGKSLKSDIQVEVVEALPENCESFDFASVSATQGEGNTSFYREYNQTTLSLTGDAKELPEGGDDKALKVISNGDAWGGVVFRLQNLQKGQKYYVDFDIKALSGDYIFYVNYGNKGITNLADGAATGFKPGTGNSYHFSGEFTADTAATLKVFFGADNVTGSFVIDNLSVKKQTNVYISNKPINNMMGVGAAYKLIPVARSGSVGVCTWSSSNTDVGSIDSNGSITAKTAGRTTITLTCAGEQDSFVLTVVPYQAPNSENFENAVINGRQGAGNMEFYSEYNNTKLSFTENSAERPAGGFGKAAKVTAANDGWSGLAFKLKGLETGKKYYVSFDMKELSGNYSYFVSSAQNKILTESKNGGTGAFKPGAGNSYHYEGYFTAESAEHTVKIFINAGNPVNGAFTVDNFTTVKEETFIIPNKPKNNTVGIGSYFVLQAESTDPSLPLTGATQWTSSNTGVASVDANGKVRAVAPGKTVIMAKNGSQITFFELTVSGTALPMNSENFETSVIDGDNGAGNMTFRADSVDGVDIALTQDPAELPAGASGKALKVWNPGGGNQAWSGLIINLTNLDIGKVYTVDFNIKKLYGESPYAVNYGGNAIGSFNLNTDGQSHHFTAEFTAQSGVNTIKIFIAQPTCNGAFTVDDFVAEEKKSLTVTGRPVSDTMLTGSTATLSFTTTGNVTGVPQWQSSDVNVSTIDPTTGVVQAVGEGTVVITLNYGGLTQSFSLTVKAPSVIIADKPNNNKILKGTDKLLSYTVLGGYGGLAVWESDNLSVALIDQDGRLTAKKAGTAVITLTYGGLTDSFAVKVILPNTDDFENVTFSGETAVGDMEIKRAGGGNSSWDVTDDPAETPAGGSGYAIKYENNGGDAWGGVNFTVNGLTEGRTYTVTFVMRHLSGHNKYYVRRTNPDAQMLTIPTGTTITVTHTFTVSSDLADNTIKLFLEGGQTTGAFTIDNFAVAEQKTLEITNKPGADILLANEAAWTLGYTFTGDMDEDTRQWTSSNEAVLTIDPVSGKVTRVSAGVSRITLTMDGITAIYDLTVSANNLAILGLPKANRLKINDTVGLDVRASSTDATALWTSGTPAVASINSDTGFITALTPGTTLITVTYDGESVSFTLKVLAPNEEDFEDAVASGDNGTGNMHFEKNGWNGTASLSITSLESELPSGGFGSALKYSAEGSAYGGVNFIPVGLIAGEMYTVEFDMKNLSGQDTYYVQISQGGASKKFTISAGNSEHVTLFFEYKQNANVQIFMEGEGKTGVFTVDNFNIKKN